MASFTASRCCATAGTSVLVAPAQCSTRLAARPSSIRGRGGALCHAQQVHSRSSVALVPVMAPSSQQGSARRLRAIHARARARCMRACARAHAAHTRARAQDDGRSPASPSTPEPAAPAAAKYQREFRSLGSQVIESNEEFENPPEEDMWEGEKFEVRACMCA